MSSVRPGFRLAMLTLLVAFCSITYELIFSQSLTVLFGQTVTRYSLTIGLYLFCMGGGAFLFARLGSDRIAPMFYVTEVVLSLVGPLGVLGMFLINASTWEPLLTDGGQTFLMIASHTPVVAVGLLSGLEIPLLAALDEQKENSFYRVLGWDYLGSLLGSVLFALWLYPHHGLIPSALAIGFSNALAAAAFFATHWPKKRIGVALNVLGICAYGAVVWQSGAISTAVQSEVLASVVQQRYWAMGAPAEKIEVLEQFNTRYQSVLKYRLTWPGGFKEICLELDSNLQMCERWVEAYHHGLVDIPMALTPDDEPLDILLIGGGDYIPFRYLRPYREQINQVDHIDIDPQFLAYAREDRLLRRYNKRAWEDPKFVTHIQDAFHFMRQSDKKYDLILIDLPGLNYDKLLPLYSVEFYAQIRETLKDTGVALTWTYLAEGEPMHAAIFEGTLYEAGFRQHLTYRAIGYSEGHHYWQDNYSILPKGDPPDINFERNPYIARYANTYAKVLEWKNLEPPVLKPNSVFAPNLQILIPIRRARDKYTRDVRPHLQRVGRSGEQESL